MTCMARLAPQMAAYDVLSSTVDWRPYLMFFQQPNFVSSTVTTDRFGFRPTLDTGNALITLDEAANRTVNLLMGNSVAFGVGATSDHTALASRLVAHSGETWLNFCGRAFGSMQELLLFQAYRHKLGRVRRVVLCTGLNDLYLSYAPKLFDEIFGIFFFSEAFHRGMNEAQKSLSGKRALLASLLRPFYGADIDYGTVTLRELPRKLLSRRSPRDAEPDYQTLVSMRRGERERVIEQVSRTLKLWFALARSFEFEVIYALQPMLPWTRKIWSSEERDLVAEQDAAGGRWHRILRAVLDEEHHQWYATQLNAACSAVGIRFMDMNPALCRNDRWLFMDRVHMNDAGQDLLAQAIVREIVCSPEAVQS
jgi:hypothetical protein